MRAEDLRYHDELLGNWEICYPGPDGKLHLGYVESLELRADGHFSWNPTPLWVKPEGRWGVATDADTGSWKLYFEERRGVSFRGANLVITNFVVGGTQELRMHWQRTCSGAVVFEDRIWCGRKVAGDASVSGVTPTRSDTAYPYLVVRVFAAVYQQEAVRIVIGTPAVDLTHGRCTVQHPKPLSADGQISPSCRALLVDGVQQAVRKRGLRMCIVWGKTACTYVEADSIKEHSVPPSGGSVPATLEFEPTQYTPEGPIPGASS